MKDCIPVHVFLGNICQVSNYLYLLSDEAPAGVQKGKLTTAAAQTAHHSNPFC